MKLLRASTAKTLSQPERPSGRAPMGRLIRSAKRRAKSSHAPVSAGTAHRASILRGALLSAVVCSCTAVCSFYFPMRDSAISHVTGEAQRSVSAPHILKASGNAHPSMGREQVAAQPREILRPAHPLLIEGASSTIVQPARRDIPEGTQKPRIESLGSLSVPVRVVSYPPPRMVRQVARAPEYELPAVSNKLTAKVYSIIKRYAPQHKYPKLIAETIVRESAEQRYDPLFVAAVIKSESAFNNFARSHKGAQGLMQIMPATGAWIANKENLPRQKLSDPEHNVRLGISYLKHLEDEYNGDRVFTLVAYNWGPGHVESASGGKRRIPKECMTYAVKILSDYRRWKAGVL